MTTLTEYLHLVKAALLAGNATEHTHRPALKGLIEALDGGVVATNEPKRIECGAPDFIVSKGHTPVGYIEAKDVGKSLDEAEGTEQVRRYRESLSNLILTNYLEFRWYVNGEHRLTARLANLGRDTKGFKITELVDGEQQVGELMGLFLESQTPVVTRPKELAERMAHIARLIRDTIERALADEDKSGTLHQQMEGFKKTLLHELTEAQFADMYAQTICYGLFAARCNTIGGKEFSREHAAYDLPKTNPFLRKMFNHIAGPDLDDRITWAVDDAASLLARADMESILADFGRRTKRTDPVVHFYETFLSEYDPKMREARGVYYTPEPVVSFIVRSVDRILRDDFELPSGLADSSKIQIKTKAGKKELHKVQILDPATGTGTFLHDVIDHIYESFAGNKGMWSTYVRDHLLPRLYGFELLMAPYSVTHLKLGLQLSETGYDFQSDERLRVYLTNTLEEAEQFAGHNLFAQWLADEANSASQVKQDIPIMVVLGNPPYSANSVNSGKWIIDQIRDNYYPNDDIKEHNPKLLLDDYVKFIRFAQWRIQQTGYGILAYISNHGYLDNPTFRRMRQSLMQTFDDLYILDLHGNKKKKERSPDGTEDRNVFDIQQGVAVGIFVKRPGNGRKADTVNHFELWGSRQDKYFWLAEKDAASTKWNELQPSAPFYLFVPQDVRLLPEYELGWKLSEVFPVSSTGVKTHRDDFVFAFDRSVLQQRIEDFRNLDIEDQSIEDIHNLRKTDDWDMSRHRKALSSDAKWRDYFTQCLYRPFDLRFYYHHPELVERAREQVMCHMLSGTNIGITFMRQVALGSEYSHFMVSRFVVDNRVFLSNKGAAGFAPLYLYPSKASLFDEPTDAPGGRSANLAPKFIHAFSDKLKMEYIPDGKGDRTSSFGPEDVFSYMYAVFHSPEYRRRYAEFLKIDFPRLPLTSNPDLFRSLCALGDELVVLHLMDKSGTNLPNYPVSGSNIVESVRYTEPVPGRENGRVWVNKTQYFDGVTPPIWGFHIGGYQVCEKWLKDRKGRTLTYDDLAAYQRIVSILDETACLMAKVDGVIGRFGGYPVL